MARKGITFTQVAEVCKALETCGERISVRAIHARTGGSMTTVLKHYRRWKNHEQDTGPAISRRLQQALLAELRQAAAGGREASREEFLQEVRELQERLAKSERRVADLEASLQVSARLCRAQDEKIQQLRRDLTELEGLMIAKSGLEELEEKKAPDETSQGRPKRKKTKKEPPDQEPNLFNF
jgi:uncharacterized protein involved in exopolysaccharide biosynthesis